MGRLAESARGSSFNLKQSLDRVLSQPPLRRPWFSGAWVDPVPPRGARLLRRYQVPVGRLSNTVEIYKLPGRVDVLYHLKFADYDLTPAEV